MAGEAGTGAGQASVPVNTKARLVSRKASVASTEACEIAETSQGKAVEREPRCLCCRGGHW